MADLIGKIINGRYQVETDLGKGGMARVYKVWDQQRAVYLAMKVLHEDLAEDRVFLRRFRREAQTLARLQHPNIVRFYGLEQEEELAFMLMDFVEGTTLRAEIFTAKQPLKDLRVLEIMRAVCAALHYAHRMRLVHCDVKPANIMIHKNGTIFVADFGIARMTESATTTMVGIGTPAYMPPEQVRGEDPIPQNDIYSLGVVLYEMLTGGERPFTGEQARTSGTVNEKVRWEQLFLEAPSPRRYNQEISPALESIILKCLEKRREDRFRTMMDLLTALERAIQEKPEERVPVPVEPRIKPSSPPVEIVPSPAYQPVVQAFDRPAPTPLPPRKRRGRLAIWGLFSVAIIAALGLWMLAFSGQINLPIMANVGPDQTQTAFAQAALPSPTSQLITTKPSTQDPGIFDTAVANTFQIQSSQTLIPATVTATPTSSSPIVYQIEENDTLFSISEKFGVDVQTMMDLNNLTFDSVIHIGDEILIPNPDVEWITPTPIPADFRGVLDYRVETGDTLASIASKFNSTVEAIIKETEGLGEANELFFGQVLKIPTNITTPTPDETSGPSAPVLGGADKIAFINANNIWISNLNGTGLAQLTIDGKTKSNLQWTPNGQAVNYIQGKCIQSVNINTLVFGVVACFESAENVEAFEISPDGEQVAISVNRELFVVDYDPEKLAQVKSGNDLAKMAICSGLAPYKHNEKTEAVKAVRWSSDMTLLAVEFLGVVSGERGDLIKILDISRCETYVDRLDEFPFQRFEMDNYPESRIIQNFSWNGINLFVLVDYNRNDGFGDLWVYNYESRIGTEISPITERHEICCYRDPQWSPDGTYLAFAFQDMRLAPVSVTKLYYVPYGEIGAGGTFDPLPLPQSFFEDARSKPQPALRPALQP